MQCETAKAIDRNDVSSVGAPLQAFEAGGREGQQEETGEVSSATEVSIPRFGTIQAVY